MAAERTFLGEAALRLQRMLGVTGATSPEFDPEAKILPIAIMGDGTLPGYGGSSLRRFLSTIQGNAAVGFPTTVGFSASLDCIITSITFSFTAASGPWGLQFFGPLDALPYAIATANGVWVDRAQSGQERSPVLMGFDNTGVAVAGVRVFNYDTQAAQVGQLIAVPGSPFLLARGTSMILTGGGNNVRVDLNIAGMALTGS